MDISPAAAGSATTRLTGEPHVTVEVGGIPADWPGGTFDLIVISELGYYLSTADLGEVSERARASLAPDGVLLACHWRHRTNYPLTAGETHEILGTGLHSLGQWEDSDVTLDIWSPDGRSVALLDGLDAHDE